jgi:threonine/homoserine/homoserine lactone efflux protein
VTEFLAALVPSAGVLFLFWLGIRALLEADRRERSAQARITAADRRSAAGSQPAADTAERPAGTAAEGTPPTAG